MSKKILTLVSNFTNPGSNSAAPYVQANDSKIACFTRFSNNSASINISDYRRIAWRDRGRDLDSDRF